MSGSTELPMRPSRIAIAGGGAAGALVATNLLRLGGAGLEIVVVEPRAELGLGVAYATRDPWHRLNVPASIMSAFPDDPDHFRRWLDVPGESFPRRLDYGRYLQAVFADAVATSGAVLRHERATVERLEPDGDGVTLGSRPATRSPPTRWSSPRAWSCRPASATSTRWSATRGSC